MQILITAQKYKYYKIYSKLWWKKYDVSKSLNSYNYSYDRHSLLN